MTIAEKYPDDMGFMFEIVNATAGFVPFFLIKNIYSIKDSFPQIMVMILQKF
jgi:hypothetical protein